MKAYLYFLLFLMFYCGTSIAQDTIYLNKYLTPVLSDNYSYYRVVNKLDTFLQVKDYYSDGNLRMEGNYRLPEKGSSLMDYFFEHNHYGKELGVFKYYSAKGYKERAIYYPPFNYKVSESADSIMAQVIPDSLKKGVVFNQFYSEKGLKHEGLEIRRRGKHGIWIEYNNQGNVSYTYTYNCGELHGESITYWSNGNRMYLRNYYYGLKYGEQITYDYDGEPKKKKVYQNGVLISKSKVIHQAPVEFEAPVGF